jgi:hypothetical protein
METGMRKLTVVAVCTVVLTSVAVAQNNLETKWHCAKATLEQAYQVPDMSGRSYGAAQGSCSATSSKTGEKSGTYTETTDTTKTSLVNHGTFVVTMEDGDKTYYSYSGMASPAKKTASNKWKITGGSGKYKAAKGVGTCSGTLNDDGSSDWDCTGTFAAGGQ